MAGSGSEISRAVPNQRNWKDQISRVYRVSGHKDDHRTQRDYVKIVARQCIVSLLISQALHSVHVECHAVNGVAPHYSAQFYQIELEVDVRVTFNISAMSSLVAYTNASFFALFFEPFYETTLFSRSS